MKTIQEIYESSEDEEFGYIRDYQPMLDTFGEIIVQLDDDNWQGDSYVLYSKNGKYGYLIFGWGSCSGCDALQGCNTWQEVADLYASLQSGIIWFDTLDDAIYYFDNHDWQGDYVWSTPEFQTWLQRAKTYLYEKRGVTE